MGIRAKALDRARSQIGYAESGDNLTKFGDWYGMNGQPWCAIFVTWATVLEGSRSFEQGSRYAYVPYIEGDAAAGRHGLKKIGKADGQPGDVITFNFDPDSTPEHVGLVEKRIGGGYQTVEGNTSDASAANGGQVLRRTRPDSQVSMIVRYPDTEEVDPFMALTNDEQERLLNNSVTAAEFARGATAFREAYIRADYDLEKVKQPDSVNTDTERAGWHEAKLLQALHNKLA